MTFRIDDGSVDVAKVMRDVRERIAEKKRRGLLTDRPLLAAVALWAMAVVIIIYTAGGAPGPLGR